MTKRDEAARNPEVTVLMPAYNAEAYLSRAVVSVLNQDYESFELLIVDDGSDDETPTILADWAKRDARIRIVRLAENGGITRALNRGVEAARGRYVARQDADDLCIQGRLRCQVEAIETSPDIVLVSAGFDLIDGKGRRIGRVMRLNPPQVTAYLLNFSNAVGGHGQVMFRRAEVLAAGGYREECELAEDYELWCRLAERGKIVTLPVVAMQQRQHGQRLSVTRSERQLTQTLSVMRARLSKLLGRRLSDEEVWSVGIIWRGLPEKASAETADAVLWEAFRTFEQLDANPEHLRRIRRAKAWRWTVSALKHARRGHLATAAHHAFKSFGWHWSGILSGMITHFDNRQQLRRWSNG